MNRVERLEKALEVAKAFICVMKKSAMLSSDRRTELALETHGQIASILSPLPVYEDVEDYCWHVPSQPPRDAYFAPEDYALAQRCCLRGEEPVKLTGTYRRPLPTPVEKMTHGIAADGSVVLDIGEQPPKGTPCVVLWEEGGEATAKPTTRSVSVDGATVNSKGYVTIEHSQIAFFTRPECHGKRGSLTFEWREEDQ